MNKNDNTLNAAEYVLGILDNNERARFERALQNDTATHEEVIYWEDQMAQVGLQLSPVAPPNSVWQRIQLQTGIRESAEQRGNIICRTRKRWRLWGAAAGVAAISAITLLLANLPNEVGDNQLAQRSAPPDLDVPADMLAEESFQPSEYALAWSSPKRPTNSPVQASAYLSPDFVGKIQDYASSVGWQVAGYNALGALEVSATGKPYTQLWERSTLELWLLPVNSYEEPISLGLLPENGARQIPIPRHVASEFYTDYNKLAVSIEPPGGSLTGEPTGDILFITTLTRGVDH